MQSQITFDVAVTVEIFRVDTQKVMFVKKYVVVTEVHARPIGMHYPCVTYTWIYTRHS